MNQGATELMLALGLHNQMVGTAYLDDYIWPKYATENAKIPVIAKSYPNETEIMATNPDFIIASYNSAFRQTYESGGKTRGIFSDETVAPCTGEGSVFGDAKATCRPQLHARGIGTYLFADACEDSSLRPAAVTEETVYSEMRALGNVFGVDAEAKITEMKGDFDSAAAMMSSNMHNGKSMKAVWLDCVGRCCKVGPGEEPQIYVGANGGAPAMLMKEVSIRGNPSQDWCNADNCEGTVDYTVPFTQIFNKEPRIPLSLAAPAILYARFNMEATTIGVFFDQSTQAVTGARCG